MKTLSLIIFLAFSSMSFGIQEMQKTADSAYLGQDYETAISIYTELVSENSQSAPLYYNLGNAYYKNNELGKAIWAYQKAKKIDPKQEDILYNLNFVSALTKDKINQTETGVSKWIARVFYGKSINFWAFLSFTFFAISALLFYFFKVTDEKNKRGIFLIGSLGTLIVFFAGLILAFTHHSHINNYNNGIITEAVVQVKTAPNAEEAVSFELHEGAKFTFKEKQTDWYRIEVGKNEGWISSTDALLY